jgi:hypothetical protein
MKSVPIAVEVDLGVAEGGNDPVLSAFRKGNIDDLAIVHSQPNGVWSHKFEVREETRSGGSASRNLYQKT